MKQFSKDLGNVALAPRGKWNKEQEYERLNLVYNACDNLSYVAKIDVPIGVEIDNREYWQPMNATGYADNNFINLTAENENGTITAYESLEEAVATILPINRKPGATLSFFNLNADRLDRQAEFELWQFNSTDLANWENKDYWNNIYYNWNVFAGWYIGADALKNHVKIPNVGQYAYVGTNLNDAVLYQCRTNGTWTNTGTKVRNYISIVVSGNITIGENGNWFSDGEDTGIPATPAVDEQIDNIIMQIQQHTTEINSIKDYNANLQDQITSNDSDITNLTAKHESLSRTVQGIAVTGGASTATNVTYNNNTSRLNAENAQDAIDELQGSKIDKTSIAQELGTALDKIMSQGAIKTELDKKIDKTSIVQELGTSEKDIISQKAVSSSIIKKFISILASKGYINADGNFNLQDYNFCYFIIKLNTDKPLYVKGAVTNNVLIYYIAFFDKDWNFLEAGSLINTGNAEDKIESYPENAYYAVISARSNTLSDIIIENDSPTLFVVPNTRLDKSDILELQSINKYISTNMGAKVNIGYVTVNNIINTTDIYFKYYIIKLNKQYDLKCSNACSDNIAINYLVFADENFNLLQEGLRSNDNVKSLTISKESFPENAAYVYITCRADAILEFTNSEYNLGVLNTVDTDLISLAVAIRTVDLYNRTNSIKRSYGKNIFDKNANIIRGFFINTSGDEQPNSDYFISDYIPLKGKKAVINMSGGGGFCAAYDKNFNLIKSSLAIINENTTIDGSIDGYEYCRVSGNLEFIDQFMVEYGDTHTSYEASNPIAGYIEDIKEETYPDGGKYVTKDSIAINDEITCNDLSVIKNDYALSFYGLIESSDISILIGTYAGDVTIDGNNVSYGDTTKSHGLVLKDFLSVSIMVKKYGKGDLTINTNGGTFTVQNIPMLSVMSRIRAKCLTGSFKKVSLSFHSSVYSKPIWVLGDSYIDIWSPLIYNKYSNVMYNGYGGYAAINAYQSFMQAIKYGKPKTIVWAIGMNNWESAWSDNDIKYDEWIEYTNKVVDYCEKNNINIIFITAPNTPQHSNAKKTAYTKSTWGSSYRIVDVNDAVLKNTETNEWYDGMLASDSIHPTGFGATSIASYIESHIFELS